MCTTNAECRAKSKNCAANDFWAFYLQNQSFIDKIIFAQTRRFEATLDLGDMKQQLLLLLYRNKVLETFDPAKSSIWTYLTNKIYGYALHIYTASKPIKLEAARKISAEQVFFPSLNGISSDRSWEQDIVTDVPSAEEAWEDQFAYRELIDRIMKELSPTNRRIMGMVLDGMTQRDISSALGVSPQAVLYRLRNVRKKFMSMVKREMAVC